MWSSLPTSTFRTLRRVGSATCLTLLLAGAVPSWAGTGGDMPWDAPLEVISANLSGPTARKLIIIAIVLAGVGLMFSEGGGVFRKVVYVVFGGIIVASAASFGLPFIGFAEAGIGARPPIPSLTVGMWLTVLGTVSLGGTCLGLHMERVDRVRGI